MKQQKSEKEKISSQKKKKVPDEVIIESYSRLKNIWKVGNEVGLCGQSVQERLVRLNINRNNPLWTEDEDFFLREHYNNYLLDGKLQELADKMGRTKPFICRQAKRLGLTDINRKKKMLANFKPNVTPGHWDNRNHPKGMKGKHHSENTKDRLSVTSKDAQKKINDTPGKREAVVKKMIHTKHERGNLVTPRQKQTWKAGWREIGGKRKYFRSRWEANYARYLESLKVSGQIKDWEHEAKVFWFEGIKRGCVSFLPDFQITELSGSFAYHEVKGWMDDRSKTKIRRMSIYYPDVPLVVIDAKWFKENNKHLTLTIYGWET